MRKFLSLLLAAGMTFLLAVPALAAGAAGFQRVNVYTDGQFSDVPSASWYGDNVRVAYEYGLMTGKTGSRFDPGGELTVAEAVVIASRLHSAYYGNTPDFDAGDGPWYQPYVDYALRYEIIDAGYRYTALATRLDFALFISNALPDSALPQINQVEQNDIPDLYSGSPYDDAAAALLSSGVLGANGAYWLRVLPGYMGSSVSSSSPSKAQEAVYRLYRAGILTGNDESGTFTPEANITRSSVAAIVSRVVEPSLRKRFTLVKKLVELTPVDRLANLPSVRERASAAQLAEAYDVAKAVVEPLRGLSREAQLCGVAMALRVITEEQVTYSMDAPHYSDPYGFFVLKVASCAGSTRATGLCLNMLGIPYEHVNENAYSHQWTRVNVNGVYWICDAYGLYCGPEQSPYRHPNVS